VIGATGRSGNPLRRIGRRFVLEAGRADVQAGVGFEQVADAGIGLIAAHHLLQERERGLADQVGELAAERVSHRRHPCQPGRRCRADVDLVVDHQVRGNVVQQWAHVGERAPRQYIAEDDNPETPPLVAG
jgi:hypothetical protein